MPFISLGGKLVKLSGLPWLTSSIVETLTSKAIYPRHLSHCYEIYDWVRIYNGNIWIGMVLENIEYMKGGGWKSQQYVCTQKYRKNLNFLNAKNLAPVLWNKHTFFKKHDNIARIQNYLSIDWHITFYSYYYWNLIFIIKLDQSQNL
jgi:hypothetical protein